MRKQSHTWSAALKSRAKDKTLSLWFPSCSRLPVIETKVFFMVANTSAMVAISWLPEAISSAVKIGPCDGDVVWAGSSLGPIMGSSTWGEAGEVGGVWKWPTLDCLSVETDLFLLINVAAADGEAVGPLTGFFFEFLVIEDGCKSREPCLYWSGAWGQCVV